MKTSLSKSLWYNFLLIGKREKREKMRREKGQGSSLCLAPNPTGIFSLRKWLKGGSDLLFPPSCPVCGVRLFSDSQTLCPRCLGNVLLIRSPLCTVCGREMSDSTDGDHHCDRCLRSPPPYSSARGVAHYQEPVSTLLHRLKYKGETSVLPALREVIGLQAPCTLREGEKIIPVPLHLARLRRRGFNQALILANLFFSERKDSILIDTLIRSRHTISQTGLDGKARRKNLHQAFAVRFPERVRGRMIVLVDDVFTTGTTVAECSRTLLGAGADDVRVVTLARVRE